MTQEEFGLRLLGDCAVDAGAHVLAAVSGGADSTALLCFFSQIRSAYPLRISCAHVEHGIRGAQSQEDMAFVRALCEQLDIPFYVLRVDVPAYAAQHGCGLEDAARTLRYDFLYRTADEIGADFIALAHHAGDQAETVLLHAVRGCDVHGLQAMRMRSGRLIRPLLDCTSQQLREYLVSIGQPWREDASNTDERYARNRIRSRVMPQLTHINPGAGEALCRLAQAARRDEDYFARQIDALDLQVVNLIDGVAVSRQPLASLHPALLSRVIVQLIALAGIVPQSADVIGKIMDALEKDEASVNLTDGAHAQAGKKYLCLIRAHAPQTETPLQIPGITQTPFGRFEIRMARAGETGDGRTAQRIPRRLLEGSIVTGRRAGDTMIPFGRSTPVKLKKMMIDAGIERAMRASVPVLRSREGEILFAAGLRCSERCRGMEDEEQMIVRCCGVWAGKDEETQQSGGRKHD